MDWQFWIPLIISLFAVYQTFQQTKLMKQAMSLENPPSKLKTYWPIWVLLLLTIGVWVPYMVTWFTGPSVLPNQPVNKTQTTIGMGSDSCDAEIDTTFFMKYREEYKIALVCGVANEAKDKYEDRSISISQPFTIVEGRIKIHLPYTADMINASKEYLADYAKSSHPGKPNLPLLGSFWNEWVLIPKSVNVMDIKKLSDVDAYKGKIVNRDIPGA